MNIKRVTTSFLSILILTTLNIEASDVSYTTNNISAFTIPAQSFSIKGSYNKINDDIDFFNIKESELGSDILSEYATLGDAEGFDLSLAYGINDYASIYYDYENLDMKYIQSSLSNNKHDIFLRLNISNNPSSFFNAFSVDMGYTRNSSSDLDIRDVSILNKLFKKVNPDSNIFIKEDKVTISVNDELLRLLDQDGNPIAPYLKIGDLSDNSFYLRFLTGIKYERTIFDMYAGIKYIDIQGEISLEPANDILKEKASEFGESDISRDEKLALIGFSYKTEIGRTLLEASYEYNIIFGRDITNENNHNHIVNAAISRVISKNMLIFIGGKIMLNQFNGVIPYLYNEYTASQYDKKYGYMKIGFVYNFKKSKIIPHKMGF